MGIGFEEANDDSALPPALTRFASLWRSDKGFATELTFGVGLGVLPSGLVADLDLTIALDTGPDTSLDLTAVPVTGTETAFGVGFDVLVSDLDTGFELGAPVSEPSGFDTGLDVGLACAPVSEVSGFDTGLVFGSASATFGLATALATGFAFASNVAAGCAEDVVTTALLSGASSSLLLSDVVKCMDLLRVARKTLDLDGSDSCE